MNPFLLPLRQKTTVEVDDFMISGYDFSRSIGSGNSSQTNFTFTLKPSKTPFEKSSIPAGKASKGERSPHAHRYSKL
jgi:hypothetical protein